MLRLLVALFILTTITLNTVRPQDYPRIIQNRPGSISRPESTIVTLKMLDVYEQYKKDKAVGFLWSAVIPGGGEFYVDHTGSGIFCLIGNIGSLVWISINNNKRSPENNIIPFVGLIAIRVGEFIDVNSAIDIYNDKLRKEILFWGLPPVTVNNKIELKFKINL